MISPTFDPADLELLLELYNAPADADQSRRPPWTWPMLTRAEREALARMVTAFVYSYNRVYAVADTELIPPCWPQHPGLATELAVLMWHWYAVHVDPKATVQAASEYYLRHIPGFRPRVEKLLGISPGECRRSDHPASWRNEADDLLTAGPAAQAIADPDLDQLGSLNFGFPSGRGGF
jgi:hypothetical protein